MNPAAPSPSDSSIAQAFRDYQAKWPGDADTSIAGWIERRARELDASAPAAAVGGDYADIGVHVGPLLDTWQFQTDSDLQQEMREAGIGKKLDALMAYMDDPEMRDDGEQCCDTPAYCSSVRRCTAKDTPRDERKLSRGFDAAIDSKALATAQEIALMWGNDRGQFVSRIQVAVIEAMRWMISPAAPVGGFVVDAEEVKAWADLYDVSGRYLIHAYKAVLSRHAAQPSAKDGVRVSDDDVACAYQVADSYIDSKGGDVSILDDGQWDEMLRLVLERYSQGARA